MEFRMLSSDRERVNIGAAVIGLPANGLTNGIEIAQNIELLSTSHWLPNIISKQKKIS